MNYILFTSLFCYVLLHSAPTEPYEGLPVRKIIIQVENQAPSDVDDEATVLHKLHTKMGDAFDQETFDRDLRVLSNEYEWVEPSVKVARF